MQRSSVLLPEPGRTDHHQDLTARDLEVDVLEDVLGAEGATVKPLVDALEPQEGGALGFRDLKIELVERRSELAVSIDRSILSSKERSENER